MALTRIVVTADFHGWLPNVPPCDLLLIAGDITPGWSGSLGQERWLTNAFARWLSEQPAQAIVGVAGNMDYEADDRTLMDGLPWLYLQNEAADVDGVRVWGSPCARAGSGMFTYPDADLAATWAKIPDDTQVVLTHGPAYGLLDEAGAGNHVGSTTLRKRLRELPALRLFACGHIHEAYGQTVASTGAGYGPRRFRVANGAYVRGNPPIVIDLEGDQD